MVGIYASFITNHSCLKIIVSIQFKRLTRFRASWAAISDVRLRSILYLSILATREACTGCPELMAVTMCSQTYTVIENRCINHKVVMLLYIHTCTMYSTYTYYYNYMYNIISFLKTMTYVKERRFM